MPIPFFSIIIPAFHSQATIQRCLDSVFGQTWTNFEVILADAASRDDTVRLAKERQDQRLVVSSEADLGLFDGMNRGLSLSRGRWLLVLGSDDELFSPYTLQQAHKLLSALGDRCRTAAYGNVYIQGSTGWAQDGDTHMGLTSFTTLVRSNLCQQAIFYWGPTLRRRDLQFNLELSGNGGDHACHCRLWCLQPFVYLPLTVSLFNAGGTSSSAPTTYRPQVLQEARVWPASSFSRWQRFWYPLRCLVAWKRPRLYRAIARLGRLLPHRKLV